MTSSTGTATFNGLEGTLRCSRCGVAGYPTDKYCACCGSPLHHICKNCGSHVLQPVAYYCTQCGVALEPGTDGNL